jgi:malate dehydrogenase (oxaloacetate-decarboxylating)(NADP+)
LNDWREKTLCFNDDIQGTGGVICAGVINAVKLTGVPIENHRFLFFGAGGAATGVAQCIQHVMMERTGLSKEETAKRFWMVDSKGLVTKNRGDQLDEHKLAFARDDVEVQQKTLLDVVRYVKPTAIIGLASIPGAFNETIIKEMSEMNERPIILALSNPTSQSECTAEEVCSILSKKG